MKELLRIIAGISLWVSAASAALPERQLELGMARVTTGGDSILLDTGRVQRSLKWTGQGLLTVGLKDCDTGRAWTGNPDWRSDWQLPGPAEPGNAVLKDVVVRKWNDEGFASDFIEVMVEVDYPEEKVALRWKAWVWPDAPGFRTQLSVKALTGYEPAEWPQYLGLDRSGFKVVNVSSATDEPYRKKTNIPDPIENASCTPLIAFLSSTDPFPSAKWSLISADSSGQSLSRKISR